MLARDEIPGGKPDMITPREAAFILSVGVITLRRWAEAGKIRSTLTQGRQRRYYRQEIEELAFGGLDD